MRALKLCNSSSKSNPKRHHGPSDAYLRYINAYCDWARHPGERRTRHHSNNHLDGIMYGPKSLENHSANFWNSFIDPFHDATPHNRHLEFESVSPFDSRFPRIMEVRTCKYWDIESVSMKEMKVDTKRAPRLDLVIYCSINRDRGMPQPIGHLKRRLHEPPNTPSYLDPFDDSFACPELTSRRSLKHKPRLETVYESVTPFDERFPALELVDITTVSQMQRKRRHRLSHKEKRSRLIQKKMREYARETVIRKRKLRKAFRAIPEGLRFPSPGYKTTFISVSPFDESFPNGLRAPRIVPIRAGNPQTISPKITLKPQEPAKVDIKLPVHTCDPFPALTPIAAQAFAKRGFFGDLSPRQAGASGLSPRQRVAGDAGSMTHGLF